MLASYARADMFVVDDEIGLYRACPTGKDWPAIEKCIAGQGHLTVLRKLTGAILIRLDQLEGKQWVDAGIYLYTEQKTAWRISGSFFGRGTEYEILHFAPFTAGTARGFRIDIGQASSLWVQLDGVTTLPATRRAYQTMFCSAANQNCLQVTESCEVLVRGHAYWTLRGDIRVAGNEVTIAGDRKLAGPFCMQAERAFLGWPQVAP
jgi:hypothetical protein